MARQPTDRDNVADAPALDLADRAPKYRENTLTGDEQGHRRGNELVCCSQVGL